MPTLSEYAKLSNDEVKVGVIEEIIKYDDLFSRLQFKSIEGNSLSYNRELTNPAAATFAVGGTWVDSDPTFTNKTATLQIVGVQSSQDQYIAQTRSNIQDQTAVLWGRMGKGVGEKVKTLIVTGDPDAVGTEWEGLTSLLLGETRMMAMDDGAVDGAGAAETELTLDRLDAMIDLVNPGMPDILMMNRTMRRKLTALSRGTGGGVIMNELNQFGQQVTFYNGIPIVVNDRITNAEQYEAAGTWPSSTATSIFALKLGEENDGYTILHNGDFVDNLSIQDIGLKENKNERGYRMVSYLQAVTFSSKAVAALGGIDSAS